MLHFSFALSEIDCIWTESTSVGWMLQNSSICTCTEILLRVSKTGVMVETNCKSIFLLVIGSTGKDVCVKGLNAINTKALSFSRSEQTQKAAFLQ